MREKPILFSTPMVQAICRAVDPKTQTRRPVKDTGFYAIDSAVHGAETAARELVSLATKSPYGLSGDRLWVREAWRIVGNGPDDTIDMFDRDDIQYRADDDQSYIEKYRPSIFMPRWASRITLEITDVRVERLQDISEADAIAEGVETVRVSESDYRYVDYRHVGKMDEKEATVGSAVQSYATLWESINGAGSWAANPWVWVVEFKQLKGGAA